MASCSLALSFPLSSSHSLSVLWGKTEKVAVCKPGKGSSPQPNKADTLSGALRIQNWENRFLTFKPLGLWYFVIAAWADLDTLSVIIDT